MSEKWKEYLIEGEPRLHFIVMPKGIRLWYYKAVKYVYIDFDLYPTKYELTKEGMNAVFELYKEVANKKSSYIAGRLTAHLKIPKEKFEYTIIKLMEIITAKIQEDRELKKFEEQFGLIKDEP